MEALIVNPFDARATANTIDKALHISSEEQAERMRLMRELVSENNVFYWAGRMLLDAARLRKRRRIETFIDSMSRGGAPAQAIELKRSPTRAAPIAHVAERVRKALR